MEEKLDELMKRINKLEEFVERSSTKNDKKEEIMATLELYANRQFEKKQRKRESVQTIFTTGQVARICKVASRTVTKWIESGILPGYRIPGSQDRRVRREDLIHFLKHHGMPHTELEGEGKFKILCVDSSYDRSLTGRIETFLPSATYEVKSAPDVFEAGMVLGKSLPDFVIIDFNIGRADAILIATKLNSAFPEVAKIAIMGDADPNPAYIKTLGMLAIFEQTVNVVELTQSIEEEVHRWSMIFARPRNKRRRGGEGLRNNLMRPREETEAEEALQALVQKTKELVSKTNV